MKFARIEDADAVLADFAREPLPYEAAFLTGKAFLAHRSEAARNAHQSPDLYIGARALVARMTLLTRDATRYRAFFPALHIVAPA